MVTLGMLWLPILGAAVLVFLASALIHMVLPIHKSDYKKLPDEEAVRAALLKALPGPGQYVIPWCSDMKEMTSPEMIAKQNQGPNGLLFLRPNGQMSMGATLGKWFLVCLLISATTAYLASQVLPAGSTYLAVFCPVATAAFMAYGYANLAHSIWGGRPWIIAIKELFDALVYACLTAGMFGWRWPH